MSREAVIVSYARTGLAKSARGGFNITPTVSIAAHAVKHAVERAGVAEGRVEDCFMGNCAHGAGNIGRQAALLAGLPITTSGVTVNRFCSSGLQSIAMAANSIRGDQAQWWWPAAWSRSPFPTRAPARTTSIPKLTQKYPAIFMPMIDTADIVAERYKVSREYQDEYSLESQRRMAAAQQAGKFKDEIVPMKTKMKMVNKETKEENDRRLRGRPRRVQPSRHHDRRPRQARAGEGPGQVHHRRQRLAALRRRRRRGADGSQGSRTARPARRWAVSWAGPSPAASPTRWASARCSPCRACSSATA